MYYKTAPRPHSAAHFFAIDFLSRFVVCLIARAPCSPLLSIQVCSRNSTVQLSVSVSSDEIKHSVIRPFLFSDDFFQRLFSPRLSVAEKNKHAPLRSRHSPPLPAPVRLYCLFLLYCLLAQDTLLDCLFLLLSRIVFILKTGVVFADTARPLDFRATTQISANLFLSFWSVCRFGTVN